HNGERVLLYTMSQDVLTGERIPIIELPEGVTIKTVKAGNAYGEKQIVSVALVPEVFTVHQNYPNPFNPRTTIQVDLVEPTQLNIIVHDIMGRVVKTLINQEYSPGYHTFMWHGDNSIGMQASSGVYFISVSTHKHARMIKAILLR
ncbi:uncharacterized protein METZ01_LOCUS485085, partial [marine metagenome]